MTLAELRALLAGHLPVPIGEVADDTNLIEAGMESLVLMRFLNELAELGVLARYGELVASPTLAGWHELLSGR
ncbi:phosphopantetheine-binding protein [Amycolatopsis jejuensis]|uniref:phosphopantetheine-binding protein n=1 Tax=Amycolatopsis jejuensis TaxID=330084 RepID=UPI0005264099|nr:phosphopantetheine-binding protein [Amycolatopsis jejuensis]